MPIIVRDLQETRSVFSRTRLAAWVSRTFDVPPNVGRKIARAVHREIASRDPDVEIGASEVFALAGRLTVRYAMGTALVAASSGGAGGIVKSFPVADVIGPVVQGITALIEYFRERGYVEDGPGYMKKEEVGFLPPFDDQKAPQIRNVVFSDPSCCTTSMGSKGIKFKVSMEVTDTGGVGNSSGVKRVRICAIRVRPGGQIVQGPCAERDLSEQDEERSEDDWVSVELELCVPCQFIGEDGIDVAIGATDDDDNDRVCFNTVDIPRDTRAECCLSGPSFPAD